MLLQGANEFFDDQEPFAGPEHTTICDCDAAVSSKLICTPQASRFSKPQAPEWSLGGIISIEEVEDTVTQAAYNEEDETLKFDHPLIDFAGDVSFSGIEVF